MSQHYIGLMSGTSVDGIDAVAIAIGSGNKRSPKFKLLAARTESFVPAVAEQISSMVRASRDNLDNFGALNAELGTLFATAALHVMEQAGLKPQDIRAVGSHGQTLRHRPNGTRGFTIQAGDPSIIAELTGITTIADFRARDIAAGGQGAPLVPAFHRWLFHSPTRNRVIINIGGIANITHMATSEEMTGFDTGPGNTLLDQWILRHRGTRYDVDGAWAKTGRVSTVLLQRLIDDPYFAQPHPKSTGREHFNLPWLDTALATLYSALPVQDVQATLVELTAHTIALGLARIPERTDEIYLCGGGSHNAALRSSIERHISSIPVQTTEVLGLHPDWVEACAFAWLAHQRLESLPGNLPNVTGARHAAILGGIYAGNLESMNAAKKTKTSKNKKGG